MPPLPVTMTPVASLPAPLRVVWLIALLAVASCASAGSDTSALPPPGTAVFGPQGLFGTVTGSSGGVAVVNPIAGGAPALLVPNGNGTATVSPPDQPGFVVPSGAR